MKILIAGSHGMVGSVVTRHFEAAGHQVVRLVRSAPASNELWWDPDGGQIDAAGLDGFDAVVHVASMTWPMRWAAKAKEHVRLNRLATNRLLAGSLAACAHRPRVLVCASGMGYYPSSGDAVITEESPSGTSFLATLQRDGEAATAAASDASIRVIHLRIPPVIGGAALQRIGFQAGDGHQWTSWVGRAELASIIEFCIATPSLAGPVNAVSPNPLRNADFAAVTSRVLGQKPGCVIPAFVMRVVFGEMGEELLMASRRIQPSRLLAAGYRFRFPDLEQAIRHEMEILDVPSIRRLQESL